jgi:hypothetical protein
MRPRRRASHKKIVDQSMQRDCSQIASVRTFVI